jgi:nitroimidazol reductase NimA-like FMN-containing flavoprotein (pyridoxamine 5'-phosphate oxidase superfamily)
MSTEARSRVEGSALGELTQAECQQHLASATMGRVSWSAGTVQHILPVSYAMHVGKVVFRTSPYGTLAHLERPTNVAFEIDAVDEAASTAWSVVVQGRAQAVVLNQVLTDLWARGDIVPWAPATRNLFISITPHTISGRRVRAPFADLPQPPDFRASADEKTPS